MNTTLSDRVMALASYLKVNKDDIRVIDDRNFIFGVFGYEEFKVLTWEEGMEDFQMSRPESVVNGFDIYKL